MSEIMSIPANDHAEMQREIKRLRADSEVWKKTCVSITHDAKRLTDGIERLTTEAKVAFDAARELEGPDGDRVYKYNTFQEWTDALSGSQKPSIHDVGENDRE